MRTDIKALMNVYQTGKSIFYRAGVASTAYYVIKGEGEGRLEKPGDQVQILYTPIGPI